MKWLLPVVVVAVAVLAELTLGRASGGPDFALFFGRFHPLVVHLPIGFFLLVAMGEAATFVPKLRGRVEPALGLLIPVAAFAALAAFLMGQLLALEGGFPAGALGWHRRLTLLAVMGMAGCWLLFERQRERAGKGRVAYQAVMAATLGVLSLGAHFGGTMTRGESYLSKYAPGPLKPLLGTPEAKKEPQAAQEKPTAPSADPLVYQDVLQPVLTQYCVECHGAEKQKGKLRLDSLAELMKGGENGPVVVAGAPKKSPLLARMLLPPSDDDHMPPEGKAGPKADALELIQFWIERGASPALKVKDLLAPTTSRALLEHALGGAAQSGSVPATSDSASKPSDSTPKGDESAPTGSAAPASEAATASKGAAATPSKAGAGDPAKAASGAAAEPAPAPAPAAGVSSGPAFLAAYCEKCHGAAKQKAKLRVDSLAALLQGGANGAALVPGSPEKSSIVQRVKLALGNEDHMPPAKEVQPSATEVAALVAWVRAGASGAASSKGSGGAAPAPANGKTSPSLEAPASSPAGPIASAPDSGSPAAAPSASVDASSPAVAADVSGPASAGVLKELPPRVALFQDAVQPLLREKCGKCHIKEKPAAGLGVAQHAQLLEGGYSGPAIVPKDRKASLLMQRLVLPPADEEHMPPEGEPALAADDIELIGAWIDQGAPASGPTETARLTAGATRALAARGIHGAPESTVASATLPAQAGGCAACSVPGAPQSKWLGLQVLSLLAAASTIWVRRAQRRR